MVLNNDAPNAPSKAAFARQKQVKPDTFYKYVQDDPDKRRKLGQHAGCPSLLSKCNLQFVMEKKHPSRSCQQWSYSCADHRKYVYPPARTITTPVKKSLSPHIPQEACQQVEAKASQGSKNYIEAKPVYCRPAIPMVQIVRKGSLLPTNEEHRSV